MIDVAVVGLGHWGPNLARNVAALPGARLRALCEPRAERLERVGSRHPGAALHREVETVLADEAVDAVVLATPVASHYELAVRALEAGKHVLVEKPLARSVAEARDLVERARARRRVLMVGHVFLYNAAVTKMKELIDQGELGEIYYVYAQRLNLGIVRQDVNALWNFAPHEISIVSHWLGSSPERVLASGYSYLQPGIEDVVFMTMRFPGGVAANVQISWLDPNKVRRITVVGSRKMAVYDDVSRDAKIRIYDRGIDRSPESGLGDFESFGEFQLLVRAGEVTVPWIDFEEPLAVECRAFLEAIRTGEEPLTGGEHGVEVVRVLEAAQRSLETSEPAFVRV